MAKRRRKKPNISQTALDQALQDANGGETPSTSESESTPNDTASVATAPQSTPSESPKSRRRRRDLQSAKLDKRKSVEGLDAAYVAERLANPTKIVTEEQLQEDYGFVIRDLRNMGILAAVLFVALIGIALVIL
jgi:hypothetical protein